jgi:hypothetical protein
MTNPDIPFSLLADSPYQKARDQERLEKFVSDDLPSLRAAGFTQSPEVLLQTCINYAVETELAGSEDSDEAFFEYLKTCLANQQAVG